MEENIKFERWWVRVTRSCNNRCQFCLDSDAQDGTIIPLNELTEELKQGIKQGAKRVILSGGEPTIHPEFVTLVKIARKLGYKEIQIITNGRMFSSLSFCQEVVSGGATEITFSIHGHTPELHDQLVGVKGAFREAIKGIINLKQFPDVILNIDIVVNKKNIGFLKEILLLGYKLGIKEFDLLQIQPAGRAKNNMELLYELDRYYLKWHEAINWAKKHSLTIWTNRLPPEYLSGFETYIQSPLKLLDEVKGRYNEIYQFLNLGIYPCCYGDNCNWCFLAKLCNFFKTIITYKRVHIYISSKDELNKLPLISNRFKISHLIFNLNNQLEVKSNTYPKRVIVDLKQLNNKIFRSSKTNLILHLKVDSEQKLLSAINLLKKWNIYKPIYISIEPPDTNLLELLLFTKTIIKRQKELTLYSDSLPYCFGINFEDVTPLLKASSFTKEGILEPLQITSDFIKYNYRIKSISCKDCSLYNTCHGISINLIMEEKSLYLLEPFLIKKD